MRKRSAHLIAYSFFCLITTAQTDRTSFDSTWFENYFSRQTTIRELNDPASYDSLELVKTIAEKQNYYPAICKYHIAKASWHLSKKMTDSAITSFQIAIDIAEKQKLEREGSNAYLGLANLYQFNGNTIDAAKNYLHAASLLKDLGRKRLLIGLYRNLLTIFTRLKQKNGSLNNMLSAVVTSKSNESDLIKIINTKNSEDEGLNFPDQSLVKEVGADIIYVILGGAKFKVQNFETMASYGASRDVQRIPAGTLNAIPDMPRNGSLLMELHGDPKVYFVKDGLLYHVYSPEVLENYGSWDAVFFTPTGSLKNFSKATQQVTAENVNTTFNIKQEFDNLTDSIRLELEKNTLLSNELSKKMAERNIALQNRKVLLLASIAGALVLLLIAFFLYRNLRQRKKIYRQQMSSLEKEKQLQQYHAVTNAKEEERNRISQDLHDDLGAGITRIKFLSENISEQLQNDAEKTELVKLKDSANELVEKMSEIIWAMNEKNNSWEDLVFYLRSYAVEYCNENKLNCKFQVPDQLPQALASGETRRNVFLILKECLHNIVKHANAKNVFIKIHFSPAFEMTIQDDGTGFKMNGHSQKGNGLINIQKRIKNIGGDISIIDHTGTLVSFTAPL